MNVGKLIAQGRQAKEMSQKDLATKICEKPQVAAMLLAHYWLLNSYTCCICYDLPLFPGGHWIWEWESYSQPADPGKDGESPRFDILVEIEFDIHKSSW